MNSALTRRIERRLEDQLGLYLAVEMDEGKLVLSGMVGTEGERQLALQVVSETAPGVPIDDGIEVTERLPGRIGHLHLVEAEQGSMRDAAPGLEEAEGLEPGDFTNQRYVSDPLAASGAGSTGIDEDEVSDGDETYVAPIDPVGTSRRVVGGFELSSMDAVKVERSALGDFGDAAILEAVIRELSEDSATAGLDIRVAVRSGIVRLSGRVPGIDDADNAAEVAARVPGVRDVLDAMDVSAGRMV